MSQEPRSRDKTEVDPEKREAKCPQALVSSDTMLPPYMDSALTPSISLDPELDCLRCQQDITWCLSRLNKTGAQQCGGVESLPMQLFDSYLVPNNVESAVFGVKGQFKSGSEMDDGPTSALVTSCGLVIQITTAWLSCKADLIGQD